MKVYYNEIDKYCVEWLRNLIAEGLIANGDVDDRSIVDVRPNDLRGYTQCHFFAGLGGWSGALRLAGWPDNRAVWTGSCPCQPFSLAGRQGGFEDTRHLWPDWFYLIEKCRPAVVFGEQVASASQWLGLVRGDLEAMDYAVGAIPVEAASAGADHLRDRYWFVADDGSGRCLGSNRREGEQPRGTETIGASNMEHTASERIDGFKNTPRSDRGVSAQKSSGVGLADADDAGLQGRRLLPERAAERTAGPNGVAYTDQPCAREERQQRSGEQQGAGSDQELRALGDGNAQRWNGQHALLRPNELGWHTSDISQVAGASQDYEWVIGADGKARRVKPGIRLLAHGIPNRVAKLRALGNAIDLRPAAAFIKACA